MNKQSDIHLVLFLSRATPLSRWAKKGILTREVALYKKLRPYLGALSIVTSGGEEELAYQKELGDIQILYNRWGISPNVYSLLAPFLHWRALRTATVYKTNQTDGSWTAIMAGKLHRKTVILRAGYLWSENFKAEYGRGFKSALIGLLQRFSLKSADHVLLTTKKMRQHVIETYNLHARKINCIPNYVDTQTFRPISEIDSVAGRVCFVGRLNTVKNLPVLIQAISQTPNASLVLIGQGEQRAELEQLVERTQANVNFLGLLQHNQLPVEINRSDVFILPSHFEGHPKALIEAMACGMAVIGTDVRGIRDIIRHEETGLLCPPTVEGLQSALQRLLSDQALRIQLGQAARAFVEQEYSLERIVEMELSILQQLHHHKRSIK